MTTITVSQKITASTLAFPEKSILEISIHGADMIPYLEKLKMDLDQHFPGCKRIPIRQMADCKKFEELEERVKSATRIHLQAEMLSYENALTFLEKGGFTIVDELTCMALLDLCSTSKNEIVDFSCVAMPFSVQKPDELIKSCFVYPTKSGTGSPYDYTKNIEYVESDVSNRTNFFEFFVLNRS